MEWTETGLPGVTLIRLRRFGDHRGYFQECWNEAEFRRQGADVRFIQDNESFTAKKGTLRGIHFQNAPCAQAKLVRPVTGAIFDVAVDLRRGSPTYLQWVGAVLSAEAAEMLFIPRGFGHAFLTLTDDVIFQYKVDAPYAPALERSVRYDDPDIGIVWPEGLLPERMAEKDRLAPLLREADCNYDFGQV